MSQDSHSLTGLLERIRALKIKTEEVQSLIGLHKDVDIALAGYQYTGAAALRLLSSSSDDVIREMVASNPNTPFDLLMDLAQEFPRGFILNPVFEHLFIENSNFLESLPEETVGKLIGYPECPVDLLEWAFKYYKRSDHRDLIYQGIVRSPNASKKMISNILKTRPKSETDISHQEGYL
jgi:hypothetical protein